MKDSSCFQDITANKNSNLNYGTYITGNFPKFLKCVASDRNTPEFNWGHTMVFHAILPDQHKQNKPIFCSTFSQYAIISI